MIRTALLMAAIVVATTSTASASIYGLIDLGTLGGGESHALGVNNLGHVVGESLTADGKFHAFLYQNGLTIDLGVLQPGHQTSRANDINDNGVIVGYSAVDSGGGAASGRRPFLITGGMMTNPGSLGGDYGFANGVNAGGIMVGLSADQNGTTHAFLYGGSFTDLGSFGGSFDYSEGFDVNDAGKAVGVSVAGGKDRGFISDGGPLEDIGDLQDGAGNARAYAINNNDQIVGESSADGSRIGRAFLWQNGVMTDLGVLDDGSDSSYADDVNNAGSVVGASYSESGSRAFLWTGSDGMLDLNDLVDSSADGWTLLSARGISDTGYIVGTGMIDGEMRAYMLAPVPEPASIIVWGLMATAVAAGYAWRAKRRRNSAAKH